MKKNPKQSKNLVGVCETSHTTHDAKDIVVGGVNADLGGLVGADSSCGNDELKGGVVDSGEIAGAGWLVLLRLECEGVDIDTSIGGSGVVLVWLDNIEVGAFTFRESVLSVKLELSGDDRVLTPAVHVECGFSEDESTGITDGSGMSGIGFESVVVVIAIGIVNS